MNFVQIRSYDNYVPAHIDMGLLKEEGIESWLKDEHSVTINPVLTNAVGGIKLMVAEERAEEAIRILIREQKAYSKTLSCPRCGSNDFITIRVHSEPSFWLERLMVFLFGKGVMGKEDTYYCLDCKNTFKEPRQTRFVIADDEQNIPD